MVAILMLFAFITMNKIFKIHVIIIHVILLVSDIQGPKKFTFC